ncbi:hypothetical protein OEZ85_013294 [Tetradesmus obliquus]|uniref:Uncharacterized protein n=1 Tax=Tetradesmus obliquus TaxID=3088 RepID=A0ABY8U5A4_TETOB|nr:hypothetical protein OEZ85_013294 [Tetradesmus obliquus]
MAYNVAYGEEGKLATQLAEETGTAANWQACKRICADEDPGEFPLPLEVLQKVMSCLAQFEADGVRGPSMVACDLANAALVSKDFHKASKFGFSTLKEQTAQLQVLPSSEFIIPASVQCSYETLARLQRLPAAGGWSWQQWAACLQDPMQFSVYELKKAARQLAMPSNSSKLVSRILQAFGLQEPTSVAPQLLRAVLLERCCPEPWTGCKELSLTWELLQKLGRSEVDKLWPGLGGQLFASGLTSAAALRKALHTYISASSARQLQQLRHFLLMQLQDGREAVFQCRLEATEKARANTQKLLELACEVRQTAEREHKTRLRACKLLEHKLQQQEWLQEQQAVLFQRQHMRRQQQEQVDQNQELLQLRRLWLQWQAEGQGQIQWQLLQLDREEQLLEQQQMQVLEGREEDNKRQEFVDSCFMEAQDDVQWLEDRRAEQQPEIMEMVCKSRKVIADCETQLQTMLHYLPTGLQALLRWGGQQLQAPVEKACQELHEQAELLQQQLRKYLQDAMADLDAAEAAYFADR